jgi:uncharacterized RDD family membrane protein YckC
VKNVVEIQTPEYVKIPYQTAGVVTRGIAKGIDLLCIMALSFLLTLFEVIAYLLPDHIVASVQIAIIIVISAAVPILYFTISEYWMKGQTIGKRVMGIRVIQDNGQSPSFLAVLIRNALLLADLLPFLFLLGFLLIFLNRKEKRVGDLVAGTIVIYEKAKESHLLLQYTHPFLYPNEEEHYQRLPVISGEFYLLIESFLLRRTEMDPLIRQRLAKQLVQQGWSEIQVLPDHEELFLEKIYLYLRKNVFPAQHPYLLSQYFPKEVSL